MPDDDRPGVVRPEASDHGGPGQGMPERGEGKPGHAQVPEHAEVPGHAQVPAHGGMPDHGVWGELDAGASPERRRLENDFLLAMRRVGSIMQLLGQVSAERIGINVTDLNCLNIVALAGPMTAGDLARATGLTTASITGVLDRLEQSGIVRRERDPKDRRRVIVTLNPGPGLAQIGPTFGPVVAAWRDAAASYSDEELGLLLEFQRKLEDIMLGQLARLRSDVERRS